MLEKLNERIEEVQEQIALRDDLTSKAAEGKQTLAQGVNQLDTIEIQLGILDEEIRKLEQFGLTRIIASLSGGSEEKINALRSEYETLEQDYKKWSETVSHLEEELPKIEAQLGRFGDLDAELKSLCHEKTQLLAESGDDSGLRLEQLADELEKARDEAKKTERVVDMGEELLSSLQTTLSTTHRVRGGSGRVGCYAAGGALLGAVVSTAYSKYKDNVANKLTSPVNDSIQRFRDAIFELDLSDETSENEEIRSVLPEIDLRTQMPLDDNDDTWLQLHGLVGNVIGDLNKKLCNTQQTVETLEQEHQQILDNA